MVPYQLRFRQVHLDFHTSGQITGIGAKFDKRQWQETLRAGASVRPGLVFALLHF